MKKVHAFSTNEPYLSKLSFKPDWITNTNDIRHGTGNFCGQDVRRKRNKGGGIILSALSGALKIQMRAAYSVGNCCPNFHQIIFNMLRGGCGMLLTNNRWRIGKPFGLNLWLASFTIVAGLLLSRFMLDISMDGAGWMDGCVCGEAMGLTVN